MPEVANNRNTPSKAEQLLWDHLEEPFISKDTWTSMIQQWTINANQLHQLCRNFLGAKQVLNSLQFEPKSDFAKNETILLGQIPKVYLVLNSESVQHSTDNSNAGQVNSVMVHEIIEAFREAIKFNQKVKIIQPMSDKGIQHVRVQYMTFQYDIYPVLCNIDGSYLMLWKDDECSLLLDTSKTTAENVDSFNQVYYGLWEIIKACAILIHDWNLKNPSQTVPPSVFETIGLETATISNVTYWNDAKFQDLLANTLDNFKKCIDERRIEMDTTKLDKMKLAAWIQEIKQLDHTKLLAKIKEIREGSISLQTSNPNPATLPSIAVPSYPQNSNMNGFPGQQIVHPVVQPIQQAPFPVVGNMVQSFPVSVPNEPLVQQLLLLLQQQQQSQMPVQPQLPVQQPVYQPPPQPQFRNNIDVVLQRGETAVTIISDQIDAILFALQQQQLIFPYMVQAWGHTPFQKAAGLFMYIKNSTTNTKLRSAFIGELDKRGIQIQ